MLWGHSNSSLKSFTWEETEAPPSTTSTRLWVSHLRSRFSSHIQACKLTVAVTDSLTATSWESLRLKCQLSCSRIPGSQNLGEGLVMHMTMAQSQRTTWFLALKVPSCQVRVGGEHRWEWWPRALGTLLLKYYSSHFLKSSQLLPFVSDLTVTTVGKAIIISCLNDQMASSYLVS